MNEAVENEHLLSMAPLVSPNLSVEISGAFPVRLQKLDLTRHAIAAPDGARYVVATFDDNHLNHGYLTTVYPQQNGYLTLLRLVVGHIRSETPEEAIQQHIRCVRAIQQGKLAQLVQSLTK